MKLINLVCVLKMLSRGGVEALNQIENGAVRIGELPEKDIWTRLRAVGTIGPGP